MDFVMPESGMTKLQLAFDDYAVVDTTTQKAEEFLVSEMGDAKSISFSEKIPLFCTAMLIWTAELMLWTQCC